VIRLALRVRRAEAEIVLAELLELVPAGVEEIDRGEEVEYAIYGAPGELPELPQLRASAGDALVSVSTSRLADDWSERWRRFHRPLQLPGLTVRPPWEPSAAPRGAVDVVIDPAQAFGTGAHATTQGCLELLLELESRGSLLDLGCGSGVLAITAAKLGFAPVVAFDNDPAAVDAARANVSANAVAVELACADIRSAPLPHGDVLAANLLRPLLLALAPRLAQPRPAALILGGLLAQETDEVAAAYAASGYRVAATRVHAGWASLALR